MDGRPMEVITELELVRRCEAQGVRDHRSLVTAGAVSCEGRRSGAGRWPQQRDRSGRANRRRQQRGCNWSLGGFVQLHRLEIDVIGEAGTWRRPCFPVASPEEAQALEHTMDARALEASLADSCGVKETIYA